MFPLGLHYLKKKKYCYRSSIFTQRKFIFFPLILKTTSKTQYTLCKCLFSPLALLFFLLKYWRGGELGDLLHLSLKNFAQNGHMMKREC